ncbi:MAG: NAD(P)/FAD-dependent oxidoreductase [Rhodomicrobiaceae bacterium]
MDYSYVIVGGGIFGCHAALRLAESRPEARIAIIEREAGLLARASYNNQARVHNGYHYPRSILTGLRSRVNAPHFLKEFGDTVIDDFDQYYAIARRRSNVTPAQFETFCQQIGAPLAPAPEPVRALFNDDLVEAVYRVSEPVFDAAKLRARLEERLHSAGITVHSETEARQITLEGQNAAPQIAVEIANLRSGRRQTLRCGALLNCTYSRLNELLRRSGLQTIRLRHEMTEMALVELPPALRKFSVTVMCGPFFSLMPFPDRGLATLSHVSYTPHYGWTEEPGTEPVRPGEPAFPPASRFDRMRRDAMRYLPALKDASYRDSIWEIKTILPQSDANDSRPILFKRDPSAPNIVSLLGGKIDNIYDLDDFFAGLPAQMPEMSFA